MALTDEATWLERCRKGDHEAFEGIVREHQKMIHALCFRMTGSVASAEDLAQDTFVQAFRHLDTFNGQAKFSSWLYRIAMNLCLNWKKRECRQDRLLRNYADQLSTGAPVLDRRSASVQEALLKLTPAQRAAVILTIYEDLTHGEAARLLGCSETTVSWRVFMAKRKLKAVLQRLGRLEEA